MPNRRNSAARLATVSASSSKVGMPATMTGSSRPKPCSPASSASDRPEAAQSSSAVRLAPVTICVDAGSAGGAAAAAAGRGGAAGAGWAVGATGAGGSTEAGGCDAAGAGAGAAAGAAGAGAVGGGTGADGAAAGAAGSAVPAPDGLRTGGGATGSACPPVFAGRAAEVREVAAAGRRGRLAAALSCSTGPFGPATTPSGVGSATLSPAASGIRAARRDASAKIRAIASSSAVVEGSGGRPDPATGPPRPTVPAAPAAPTAPAAPGAPAAACTGSGTLPLRTSVSESSSGSPSLRSPSASRSLITLRGKKCSRC